MSFDQIGDIIILNDKGTKKQAKKLLKQYPSITTVLKKSDIHKGKYRTQKLTYLIGEKKKETIHKESGCRIKLDVEKCYYSPRSSNERLRITKLVKKNESILVLFSGVSPFPCVIAKNKPVKEIYAIEVNPTAHKYAKENIQLNKLKNIKLYKGDVNKILPRIKKKFDRIIMPLPKTAYQYLPLAKKKLKKGGTIHLYSFFKEPDIKKQNRLLKNFNMKITKCGKYSPYTYRVCIDIKI
jgi:tRNA (guanine37-N1)-methyltransferase